MDIAFILIALLTLASAVAAVSLRNLVHCALCLVATFGGIALTYLHLNAEFVGMAQVLVYVGAVAILVVFAILLTRGEDSQREVRFISTSAIAGLGVVALVCISLLTAIQHSGILARELTLAPEAPVKRIGEQLMTNYVLPLEVIGLLLTAAMIGAVVISMRDPESSIDGKAADSKSAVDPIPASANLVA